jgi:hypothetical protein
MTPQTPPAAPLPADPALREIAERFPEDLEVAMATAQGLRAGPPAPSEPTQEPWPPMQVPK